MEKEVIGMEGREIGGEKVQVGLEDLVGVTGADQNMVGVKGGIGRTEAARW